MRQKYNYKQFIWIFVCTNVITQSIGHTQISITCQRTFSKYIILRDNLYLGFNLIQFSQFSLSYDYIISSRFHYLIFVVYIYHLIIYLVHLYTISSEAYIPHLYLYLSHFIPIHNNFIDYLYFYNNKCAMHVIPYKQS